MTVSNQATNTFQRPGGVFLHALVPAGLRIVVSLTTTKSNISFFDYRALNPDGQDIFSI